MSGKWHYPLSALLAAAVSALVALPFHCGTPAQAPGDVVAVRPHRPLLGGGVLVPTIRDILGWSNVKDSGARGNGKSASDGSMSSTTSTTTLTSASASWSSADNGKAIMVAGAGAGGGNLITTITSGSGTTATLGSACLTTVSGARYVYGTDDTGAIQAAVNSLPATGGDIFFPDGIYVLATAPTSVNGSNAQIHMPDVNPATGQCRVGFRGRHNGEPPGPAVPMGGSILWTMATSGAVVGGRHSQTGTPIDFTQVSFTSDGILYRLPPNPGCHGLDLSFVGGCDLMDVQVDTGEFGSLPNFGAKVTPSHGTAGVIMPSSGNEAHLFITRLRVYGMDTGVILGEHANASLISIWACNAAVKVPNCASGCWIGQLDESWNGEGIICTASGTPHPALVIGLWTIEWAANTQPGYEHRVASKDVDDASNLLKGTATFRGVLGGGGGVSSGSFAKTGGTGFTCAAVGD